MKIHELETQYGPTIDAMSPSELADLAADSHPFLERAVRRCGPTGLYREPLLRALHRRCVPQQRTLTEPEPW